MSSAVVELNQLNDSSVASKSSRPHAAVELAPVHNQCDEQNKEAAQKCNHFSIRGFVSEVRKRDPKRCYPFTLIESTDPLNELPPMVVPNFRWWRCNSCVPEAINNLPKDSCRPGSGELQNNVNADPPILLLGQSSKVDNVTRVRNTETCISIDSNDDKNYPISADQKGKGKAHVMDEVPISSGCENGFQKVSFCQGISQKASVQLKVVQSHDHEVEGRSGCKQNGTIKAFLKDCKAGRGDVGPSQGYATYDVEKPQTCRGVPQVSSPHQPADLPTNSVEDIVKLPDLNECNGEPLCEVNNETTVTAKNNNQFFEDDDDNLGAERRKKPKVRLLSELLSVKEAQNSPKRKKKSVSSANSKDECIKQKRVDSHEDGTKKVIGISEKSESEYLPDSDDVSTEKTSKGKRHCKFKDQLEKKNKKIKEDHVDSSLLLQQIKSNSNHENKNSSEKLPEKNLDFLTRFSEKNSILTGKRGRASQTRKETASPTPANNQMPKECHSAEKGGDADQNATENVQKGSANGLLFLSNYLNKENDQLSVPAQGGPGPSSSHAEQTPIAGNNLPKDKEIRNTEKTKVTLSPTMVERIVCPTENASVKKPEDDGCSPLSESVPTVACAVLRGNQSDGVKPICSAENSGAMKTPVADGSSPLSQHKPMQVSNLTLNQKDLTSEVRGRIQDIDINSIPTDDKTNEQGLGDDIPMDTVELDIAELMAKNQYERHLDDPKDKHVISASPNPSGASVKPNGTYGSYGQHMHKFPQSQSQFFSITKPMSTDPRYPILNEKSGHCTYYTSNLLGVRGPPRENTAHSFVSPTQVQEHVRPYSVRGLNPNNWNENLNATIAQRYPSSFFQQVDSYQSHRAVAPAPRQSNTDHHHVWPSGMASRMPLGITNPRMSSSRSDVLNKGRIHQQNSGSFLNFNPPAASSGLDKQQNLNFSNAYNSGNPEKSAKSVDVNEAIPAMHLLSLMQNAVKNQNTELSLGPHKTVGATSSRYPFTYPNSRPTAVQDNSRHPCYPTAIPTSRPFPLTYPIVSGNIGRNSATFVGHIPLTLQGQRNMESSHFARPSGEHLPSRRPMAPPHDKIKGVASKSNPPYIHNPLQSMKVAPNLQCGAVVRCNGKTPSPAPDKVICRLNQNPSEFNDLRVVSRFMIGPDDLKPKKKRVRVRAPRPKRQNIKVNKPIPPIIAIKS